MKNHVIESYENYREEDRLATNNARRIEFINTVKILDGYLLFLKRRNETLKYKQESQNSRLFCTRRNSAIAVPSGRSVE